MSNRSEAAIIATSFPNDAAIADFPLQHEGLDLPYNGVSFAVKRGFDIAMSLLMIIMLFPCLILLALAVRRDGGPAIFRHRRIGINGQNFECLKFRTMSVEAEQALEVYLAAHPEAAVEWAERRKLQHDPRITRLGRVLRATSIDEIPQLFNVLRGDMSLIGPRPVVQEELFQHYCPMGRKAYAAMRPGITGLWQVSGRSEINYVERVRLDITYVKTWSLRQDFLILLRTIPAVCARRGAI